MQPDPFSHASLLFRIFSHLLMQLSKFVALDGNVLKRLNEVLAMTDGAGPILIGRQARIRLVGRNHRFMFVSLRSEILGLRLVELCDAIMLRRCLCGGSCRERV